MAAQEKTGTEDSTKAVLIIVGIGAVLFLVWAISMPIYLLLGRGGFIIVLALVGYGAYQLKKDNERIRAAAEAAALAAQEEERRQREAKQQEWEATEQQATRDKLREYLAALRAYALRLKPEQDNSRMLHAMHTSLDQLQSDSDVKKQDCLAPEVQNEVRRITSELKLKGLGNDMIIQRLQETFELMALE